MLNTAGLGLDQAPPIEVPFAFFLAAPLFAAAAGAVMLWLGDPLLASRWTPGALVVTHLLALGFLAQVMSGALMQMLPVLAGSPVTRVRLVGAATQVALVLGTLVLGVGFWRGSGTWLLAAGTLLACGFAVLALAVGMALSRARGVPQTVAAMRLALGALVVTVLLGLMLVAGLTGGRLARFADWVNLHLAWGLLGWAGLLIMGVAYQVVPMFHVTPAYPRWLTRGAAPLVAVGLAAGTAATVLAGGELARWGFTLAALTFVVFALVTLDRQRRRERRVVDVTLLYWWTAMGSALLAALLWFAGGRAELIGVLLLLGVGVALPSGMLFKIMPFLSWFHLQRRQLDARRFDIRVPHMRTFVPESGARIQFALAATAILISAAAALWPGLGLTRPGGLALILAAAWLEWLLVRCYLTYRGLAVRLV